VINADGSGLTRLTSDPAADTDPVWSPDGSKIAFSSNRDGTDGLYLMNRDGSGVSKVTTGIGGFHPTWSPDGTRIAFECHVDVGNRDICVINSDGTGLVRLTSDAGADYGAAWKPDGSQILFVTTRFGNTVLALMNPDGTGVTSLFSDPYADFVDQPAWSPTGAKIALHEVITGCSSSGCYSYDAISVANADGTGSGVVAYGISPAWRP
jgi:TolB protein